jgi:hypothetical protein
MKVWSFGGLDEFIRLDKALLLQMKCGLCYCCCASN